METCQVTKKKRKKKKHWIFIRNALNLYITLGRIEIFTMVNLPKQEQIYSRCPLCLQVHFLLFLPSGHEHFLVRFLFYIYCVCVVLNSNTHNTLIISVFLIDPVSFVYFTL